VVKQRVFDRESRRRDTTMHKQRAPWRMVLGTLVVTLTVLAGGMTAVPAGAADNRPASVSKANDAIFDCFQNGGEPDVTEIGGSIRVYCHYDDGTVSYCDFYFDGTENCGVINHQLTRPDLVTQPTLEFAPATPDGGQTADAQPRLSASRTDHDQDHSTNVKGKGKHHKKGGKHRK